LSSRILEEGRREEGGRVVMGSSREKRGCGGGTNHILPRGERDHNGRRNITRNSGDMNTIPHICW
jgi:hypothetical protein